MSEPFVYLNGQFLPRSRATLDIEDRGAMFADGVYEVVSCYHGRPFALLPHLSRLKQSLAGIMLPTPPDVDHLDAITRELIARNGLHNGSAYWQITRGSAPRKHIFPAGVRPTMLVMTYPMESARPQTPPGYAAALVDDMRWYHCNIKSLALLGNVLAKNRAHAAGCHEAILHRGGIVTEGSSTNVFIIPAGSGGRVLRTHPADHWILAGVTRAVVLDLARQMGLRVEETPCATADLLAADEVLLTGTTTEVAGVIAVDGRPIGAGMVGPITAKLYQALHAHIDRECGG